MIYPMRISLCTSTIETAVYENRTHGGVRGRELVTPSYSITMFLVKLRKSGKNIGKNIKNTGILK